MIFPEEFDLTPYARFGSSWWNCNLCREHGDRSHMLYHVRSKHGIKDIPELPHIRDIRLTYTKCNAKATIDYLKLHVSAVSKAELVKEDNKWWESRR